MQDIDPYLALIAGTPTDEQNQQQLAKGLRRDADFGALGVITGDAALSPLGKNMMNTSNKQAVQLGKTRVADTRQRALKKYYDTMADFQSGQTETAASKLELGNRKADETTRNNKAREAIAMMQAMRSGSSSGGKDGYKKLRSTDIKTLFQMGNVSDALGSLLGQVRDPNLRVGSMVVPGMRTVGNLLAQYGVGTQDIKASQDWWANYDKFYTLEMRNLLFGATLTTNEQRAWAGANLGNEMTDEQIEQKLADLFGVLEERNEKFAKGFITEGYNPDSVNDFMGIDPPQEELSADGSLSIPDGGYPPVNDGGTVIPNLGEMSLEELMTLRQQRSQPQ